MPASSPSSAEILERFLQHRPPGLPGRTVQDTYPGYMDLLAALGHPERHLPPVFHVAGTNGKGSVCAFLRAILEEAGHKVHVYTSPHLVRFHERIRIAGNLIAEEELASLLSECERLSAPGAVSYFEASTAAALLAFARTQADFVILETGLGGRLDATNVVPRPRATLISRLSYDHREFLGTTLTAIAAEKAGIMRHGVPCFAAFQPDSESRSGLVAAADALQAPLFMGGSAWHVEEAVGQGFQFRDAQSTLLCPPPPLPGKHQYANAGLAIAALLGSVTLARSDATLNVIREGISKARWPARLQKLMVGPLREALGAHQELWLDGGHNDSAGEVLAQQAEIWAHTPPPRPLQLIFGMLQTKVPEEFLAPLKPYISNVVTVDLPKDSPGLPSAQLAARVAALGIPVEDGGDIETALQKVPRDGERRILICGSLYLAGEVLKRNGNAVM